MNFSGVILTGLKSGAWYIEKLHQLYCEQYGENATFPHMALQVNFEPINALLPENLVQASSLLEPYFEYIETCHIKSYILANITLHEGISLFRKPPKNFISIERILKESVRDKTGSFAVLGTKFTMNHHYISGLISDKNLVMLPEQLQNKIEALRKTYFDSQDETFAKSVCVQLYALKVDYFIIACTELAVAFSNLNTQLNFINLPELQCRYLLKSMA